MFQSKLDFLKSKYGIKSFGCNFEDLSLFTSSEVARLHSMGLISDSWHKKFLMNSEATKTSYNK
jgi:hypothetical protein